jgi:tetratricopeptide (TPR) repeat protein
MTEPWALWAFLSDPRNQATLGFLGGGLVACAGGAWAVLKFLAGGRDGAGAATPSPGPSTVLADRGGFAAGRDVSVRTTHGLSGAHAVLLVALVLGAVLLAEGLRHQMIVNGIRDALRPAPGDSQHQVALKRAAEEAVDAGDLAAAKTQLLSVAREQIQAVEKLRDGQAEQALRVLKESEKLLEYASRIDPQNEVEVRTVEGYLYKTYAQAYQMIGEQDSADYYLLRALATFEELKREVPAHRKTAQDLSNYRNGIGNIYFHRGDYRKSLDSNRSAAEDNPDNPYAWHDMFLSYYCLASQGEGDLKAMRRALDRTEEKSFGYAGFNVSYLGKLDGLYSEAERKDFISRDSVCRKPSA